MNVCKYVCVYVCIVCGCGLQRNGEMLMFDTSLLHEAANTADSVRYILMLRVWHPELSKDEVQYTYLHIGAIYIPTHPTPIPFSQGSTSPRGYEVVDDMTRECFVVRPYHIHILYSMAIL
jgi:aspartyl/asparaginyl beta-hydroxylase (cupin superfamily)